MENNIIKSNSGENFGIKANMLGISLEDQVKHLNRIYSNKVIFNTYTDVYDNTGIIIDKILENGCQLILPDTKNILISDLIHYNDANKISSIILPKTLETFKLKEARWANYIERIFLYDSTNIDIEGFEPSLYSRLKMIIIKPSNNDKKPVIYKF